MTFLDNIKKDIQRIDEATGALLPQWAQGESHVLPQDVKTVQYPADERLTDGQHAAADALAIAPKGGELQSPDIAPPQVIASAAPAPAPAPVEEEAPAPSAPADAEASEAPESQSMPSADGSEPSAEDSEPPVVESTSDSAA